jgi:hypothetical protein
MVLLAATLLGGPTEALAQVSDADRATARALAQQGQEAFDRQDFAMAADRFQRARQLISAPTIELGLAWAQVGLGRLVAAQETYNRILREGVPAGAPPVFAKALADARAELTALEPRVPSVVIDVTGPPSMRVSLDGIALSAAVIGVGRPVDPGTHTVRVEADGFAPAQASFTAVPHKSEHVTLTLVPAPPGSAPPPPARSNGATQRNVGFVGIGIGAAGLALGGITGAMAMGKHSELARLCPGGHCTNQQAAITNYHLLANVSTAGFVAGGALALAGIVIVVTAPKATAPALAMSVAPTHVGARGSF